MTTKLPVVSTARIKAFPSLKTLPFPPPPPLPPCSKAEAAAAYSTIKLGKRPYCKKDEEGARTSL